MTTEDYQKSSMSTCLPEWTDDNKLQGDEQVHLSVMLERVLDEVGASEELINLRRDRWFEFEILTTLMERLKNFKMSVYVFGSQIEGTTLPDLASDIDILICDDKIPVVETIDCAPAENKSYLLCTDETMPAGYVRLQMLRDRQATNYNPHNLHSVEDGKVYLNNGVLKKILAKFALPLQASSESVSGPAATLTSAVFGESYDLVGAFRCRTCPLVANSFFKRPRPYKWPPLQLMETFRGLGCFVVPVGHPTSTKQETEWRLSFSLQERLLVHNFNSVQLKCYLVLKVVKKEIISKYIEGKSLTSYHLKTCLFYLMEQTNVDFWSTGNLLRCIQKCLEQLLLWITEGFCPNYFIPEENMFDRHIHGIVKEKLKCVLKTLLHSDFGFFYELKTASIGEKLVCNQSSDLWKINNDLSKQITKFQILSKMLEYRISETNRILHLAEKKNIADFVESIEQRISKLEQIYTVTEHTEEQIGIVKNRVLPYLKLSRHFNLMAKVAESQAVTDSCVLPDMTIENDILSPKLKHAMFLFRINKSSSCVKILEELEQRHSMLSVSVCGCSAHQKCQLLITKLKKGTLSKTDLAEVNFTPCISFLSTEIALLPLSLRFEMVRTFGFPSQRFFQMRNREPYTFWFKWAVIDGKFLMYLMLYLTANDLNQSKKAENALENMQQIINADCDLGHKETCLNVLGCILKQRGLLNKALNCFLRSYRIRQKHNAAVLHIICLLADHFRKT